MDNDRLRLRSHEIELIKSRPCKVCGNRMSNGIGTTLMCIHDFIDDIGRKHIHDYNLKTLNKWCKCGAAETICFSSKCNVNDCDW